MFRHSDVKSRIPRLREIAGAVDDLRSRGGLERVSPNVLRYLGNIVPVGLNDDGEIVLPPHHNPAISPAALAVRSGEDLKGIRLTPTNCDQRLAESIAKQHNAHASDQTIRNGLGHFEPLPDGLLAAVVTSPISADHSNGGVQKLQVPRVIVFGNDEAMSLEFAGITVPHELDHWDFFTNEVGRTHLEAEDRFTAAEIGCIAEKRAYRTSYTVETDAGHYPPVDLAAFAQRYRGLAVDDYDAIDDAVFELGESVGLNASEGPSAAVAALAATALFGSEKQLITLDELAIYQKFGLTD